MPYTVKRLIIGEDLLGKINNSPKNLLSPNKNIAVLRYSNVGNRQINSLPNCHI